MNVDPTIAPQWIGSTSDHRITSQYASVTNQSREKHLAYPRGHLPPCRPPQPHTIFLTDFQVSHILQNNSIKDGKPVDRWYGQNQMNTIRTLLAPNRPICPRIHFHGILPESPFFDLTVATASANLTPYHLLSSSLTISLPSQSSAIVSFYCFPNTENNHSHWFTAKLHLPSSPGFTSRYPSHLRQNTFKPLLLPKPVVRGRWRGIKSFWAFFYLAGTRANDPHLNQYESFNNNWSWAWNAEIEQWIWWKRWIKISSFGRNWCAQNCNDKWVRDFESIWQLIFVADLSFRENTVENSWFAFVWAFSCLA